MISVRPPLFAKKAFATDDPAKRPASVSEERLQAILKGWLDAFNSSNPADYRAFITAYIPDGLPYIDDDFSIRDVSGGLQLIRSEVPAPNQQQRLPLGAECLGIHRISLSGSIRVRNRTE